MSVRLDALRAACQEFERDLAATTTMAEAEAARARSCRLLEQTCPSEMVLRLLSEHTDALIRARYRPAAQRSAGS